MSLIPALVSIIIGIILMGYITVNLEEWTKETDTDEDPVLTTRNLLCQRAGYDKMASDQDETGLTRCISITEDGDRIDKYIETDKYYKSNGWRPSND